MTDRHTEDPEGVRPTWSRSMRPVARRVAQPLQAFLETETSSAILLLVATVAALAWANAPFGDTYPTFWGTNLTLGLGHWTLSNDLRGWVADGLMRLSPAEYRELTQLLKKAREQGDEQ